LKAITVQAQDNLTKVNDILGLYERKKIEIVDITHSQYAIHTLDFIFSRPIFKASDFTGGPDIPSPTAKRILSLLREKRILITLRESSGRRAAVYAFQELINIAEGRVVL
jgi:hypothetical protein